jgi:hypothetical protein
MPGIGDTHNGSPVQLIGQYMQMSVYHEDDLQDGGAAAVRIETATALSARRDSGGPNGFTEQRQ